MKVDLENLTLEQTKELSLHIEETHLILNHLTDQSLKLNENLPYILSVHNSRDVHQNQLFKKILLTTYIKKNKNKITYVSSRDKVLLLFLKREFGVSIQINKRKYTELIKKKLRPLSLLLTLYLQFILGRKLPQKKISLTDIHTLVEVNVVPSMISDGKFKDRYYSNFLSYLDEHEKSKIFYLPQLLISPTNRNYFFKNTASFENTNSIFKENYLRATDYIWSFFKACFLKANFKGIVLEGVRYENLLRDTFNENKYKYSNIVSLLNFRFCEKASKTELSPKVLIDWFENQAADKGLNLGFSSFFKNCKRKGYQCFSMDRNYNSHLSLIQSDIDTGTAPNSIYVTGKNFIKDCKKFTSNITVETAPAFRFSYILKYTQLSNTYISVILPFDKLQSDYIISLIKNTAVDMPNLVFKIKFHPSQNTYALPNTKNIRVTKKATTELLKESAIIISTNSSICFEAALVQMNTIIIAIPNEAFQNTIPNSLMQFSSICWKKEELSPMILELLSRRKRENLIDKSQFIEEPLKKNTSSFFLEN